MIPSSEAVAENIKKHVDAMAKEVAARAAAELPRSPGQETTTEIIERHAHNVMLDWLLGDWVAPPGKP